MKRIQEGYKGVQTLNFSWVDDSWEFVFIKLGCGNNVADGFSFDDAWEFASWGELEEYFLRDDHAAFWLERNGFHVQKYFEKIRAFFSWVPGAPAEIPLNLSGKISLPEFEKKLIAKFGINPDAYSNY